MPLGAHRFGAVFQEREELRVEGLIRLAQAILQRPAGLDPAAVGVAHVVEERVAIRRFVPLHEKDGQGHGLLVVEIDLGFASEGLFVERDEMGQRDAQPAQPAT